MVSKRIVFALLFILAVVNAQDNHELEQKQEELMAKQAESDFAKTVNNLVNQVNTVLASQKGTAGQAGQAGQAGTAEAGQADSAGQPAHPDPVENGNKPNDTQEEVQEGLQPEVGAHSKKTPFELTFLSGLKDQVTQLKNVVSKESFPRIPRATKEHTALLSQLATMMKEMNKNVKTQNLYDNTMSAEEKDFVKRQHRKTEKMQKLIEDGGLMKHMVKEG